MGTSSPSALARLKTPAAVILSALLVAQAAAYYMIPKTERSFVARPLSAFPKLIGTWQTLAEFPVESEVQAVLKADDSLNRSYARPGASTPVNLFVAFFRSQAAGAAPHSPKNCLPGAGYAPESSGFVQITIPATGETIEVNRYLVARGESKTLVLYWYQTPKRIVASEYAAKFWLAADSVRYRRSDTSLVRVISPVGAISLEEADRLTQDFVKSLLPELNRYLPRL
jgi:EpsI family protein